MAKICLSNSGTPSAKRFIRMNIHWTFTLWDCSFIIKTLQPFGDAAVLMPRLNSKPKIFSHKNHLGIKSNKYFQIFLPLFMLFLLSHSSSFGQELPGVVAIRNAPEGTVELKWISDQIFTKEDINIYRRKSGTSENSWVKINENPIGKSPDLHSKAKQLIDELVNAENPSNTALFVMRLLDAFFQNNKAAQNAGMFYVDRSAETGKRYDYRIMTIGNNGKENLFAQNKDPFQVNEYKTLAPPDSLITSGEKNAYRIGWKPEVYRYLGVNIYGSLEENGPFEKLNDNLIFPVQNSFAEEGTPRKFALHHYIEEYQKTGETKYFRLKSYGFFADSSDFSEVFPITILPSEGPPAIDSLAIQEVQPEARKVKLVWASLPEPNKLADIPVGLQLYRSYAKGTFSKVGEVIPLEEDVNSVEVEAPYYGFITYKIATIGKSGLQTFSKTVEIDIPDKYPPAAPKNIKAIADEGMITISWDSNEEEDFRGYFLYATETSYDRPAFFEITPQMLTEPFFIDSFPMEAKNEFGYRVMAIDSVGNEGEFSEIAYAQLPDVLAPPEPLILRIVEQKDALQINWVPAYCDDLQKYELYRSNQTDSSNWQLIASTEIPTTDKSYLDQNYSPGEQYYYKMLAEDQVGNRSAFSNIQPITTKEPIPEGFPPSNFSSKYRKKDKSVTLTWELPKEAKPTGIIVYRQENDNRFFPLSPLLQNNEYKDESTEPGNTYAYKARVFYDKGVKVESEVLRVSIKGE